MFILGVDMSIKISKSLLPELLRGLIITISDLGFFLMDFCLKVLSNYLFLLNIFMIIRKKLSNFSFVLFFNICFEIISSCFALGIISDLFKFLGIGDKKALKYV